MRLLFSKYRLPVNIGNPDEFTILQFAKMVIKLSKTKSRLVYKSLPVDDPKTRQPNITLAKKQLDKKAQRFFRNEAIHIVCRVSKKLLQRSRWYFLRRHQYSPA
ncbi:MAG: hypothetical protein GY797_15645 [Deltaproteobacteria bacterium]|nr:hypothetical protein [Deltaproteobacteria bacterium]